MKWKVYIINLTTATIRRKFIKKQLKKIKYNNYEIVDAVNAFEIGEEWLQDQLDHTELVKPMTGSLIACTLSHKLALEKFVADDTLDYIVILEDDALLPDDFVQIVESAIRYIGKDDIVMLAGMLMEPFDYFPVKTIGKHTTLIKPVDPYARPFTTAAYLMPKEVAIKHLKVIYPVTDAPDSWEYYKRKGSIDNIYLTYPFAVDPEVFQSSRDHKSLKNTIANWIIYYQVPFLYSFFKKRRRVTELERLQNVHIVTPIAETRSV